MLYSIRFQGGSVNGNDIVFQTNRYRFKSDWWNNLQLFRRYGSDLMKQSWIDDLVVVVAIVFVQVVVVVWFPAELLLSSTEYYNTIIL